MNMKKILFISFITLLMTSCYEDYVKDYDYSGIYFANQINTRTVVVGEGMKIEVGAALAGVMENKQDRVVVYDIDNALIDASVLEAMKSSSSSYIKEAVEGVDELRYMPEDYYSISNDVIVIPKGDHLGKVTLKVDSLKFVNDPLTLKANYAIPFKITRADADTVLLSKSTMVLGLKYENMLFGNYWHGGITVVKNASGEVVETKRYYTQIPQADNQVWSLTTVAPTTLVTNKIGDGEVAGVMKLTLNHKDGTIQVSSDDPSLEVSNDGECVFNKAKLLQDRKIFLKYSFRNPDGTTSYATDTLTFRNRIRDGINEWQDENPEHYE